MALVPALNAVRDDGVALVPALSAARDDGVALVPALSAVRDDGKRWIYVQGGKMILLRYFLWSLCCCLLFPLSSAAEQLPQFSIKSSSFKNKQTLPALYTCDGKDLSPSLIWSDAPAKTETFTLICDDSDAPGGIWYHWLMFNIPSQISTLSEGAALPAGASLGKNSWGRMQYNGPCPPAATTHRYRFTLYALDTRLKLPSGADAKTVFGAMQGHILSKATLMGVFGH